MRNVIREAVALQRSPGLMAGVTTELAVGHGPSDLLQRSPGLMAGVTTYLKCDMTGDALLQRSPGLMAGVTSGPPYFFPFLPLVLQRSPGLMAGVTSRTLREAPTVDEGFNGAPA